MIPRLVSVVLAVTTVMNMAGCREVPSRGRLERVQVPAPSLAGSVFPNASLQPGIVYLPPSYDESTLRRYPVIYYLPGFTTDVTEYLDGTIYGLHIDSTMDRAIAAHQSSETILVIINGRNSLGGSFYVDSPVTGNWERYVLADVVRYVDDHYRTLAQPASRGLTGESMGGFGALHLATRHPDVFGAVYAMSPGLFDGDGLADQGMFSRRGYVRAYWIQKRRMRGWLREESPRRFESFINELYAAGGQFDYNRAFQYAYGAAFAPDPEGSAPFVAYPCSLSGDSVLTNGPLRARYEQGFGGWSEKVAAREHQLRSLRGIALDYGREDRLRWIPRGCEHLARLLQARGIAVELYAHDGGHIDRLGERIEQGMLPFFARRLDDGSHASPSPGQAHASVAGGPR